jgi:WD repeat-containing protein 61
MSTIEVTKIATYSGHKDCIYTIVQGINPSQFFTGDGNGMVVSWDLQKPDEGKVFAQVAHSIYALCVDENTNTLIIGENTMGLHIIDLIDQQQTKSLKITDGNIFDILTTEKTIIVACGDGKIIILDKFTHSILKTIHESDKSARCIAIKERTLMVGYSDHKIRVFNLDTFESQAILEAHQNSVFSICFNKGNNHFLSTGRDAQLKIWHKDDTFQIHQTIVAHLFAINHICFHPEGNLFATCSMDKTIKIWDAHNYQLLKVIDKSRHAGHGTSINKLMWTTFENTLISVSDDKNISVWKLDLKIKNIK